MLTVDNGTGDGVNYVVSLLMRERLCSLSADERERMSCCL
jgi:hypothetical protein